MKAIPFPFDVRRSAACFTALILLIVAAACSPSDLQPTQPALVISNQAAEQADELVGGHGGRHGFFPLAIGNEWLYSGERTMYVEGDSFAAVEPFDERRTLIGTEELFGRNYVVEQRKQWNPAYPPDPWNEISYRVFYRQDKAGLYEADVPGKQPSDSAMRLAGSTSERAKGDGEWRALGERLRAAVRPADSPAFERALTRLERKVDLMHAVVRKHARSWPHRVGPPGGVLPDELTRLKYPLHPGQTWTIRDVPRFTSTVEAREMLDLPAGRFGSWRVRIDIDGLGPSDYVLIWYGRDGFLKLRVHAETEETTYEFPYGSGRTQVFEECMSLESLETVR